MNSTTAAIRPRYRWAGVLLVGAAILAFWWWRGDPAAGTRAPSPVSVSLVTLAPGDVPVRLSASATAVATQSVDIRPQIAAPIQSVHVREGQWVKAGAPLFTLDVRAEAANADKAQAQLAKSRAELANAERNLRRQQDLFARKFIAQTALDAAQNAVESWRAQVAADAAALQAAQVARSYGELRAPIAGRVGAVNVYPGTLVQPGGAALLSIARIDPIELSFTLPERELGGVQAALAAGLVPVQARLPEQAAPLLGELSFVDNAVDVASGTIRLKARFANADGRLWPGQFATVELTPRVLHGVLSVPAQAVQSGPDKRFVYVAEADGTARAVAVEVTLVQDGVAVIAPVAGSAAGVLGAGSRVVVEGAQNIRPDSRLVEAAAAPAAGETGNPRSDTGNPRGDAENTRGNAGAPHAAASRS